MKKVKLQTKFSAEQVALYSLDAEKTRLIQNTNLKQSDLDIITDKLRRYLGENSKIYSAFSSIDISLQVDKRNEKITNAVNLIEAAVTIIKTNGLYEDLQIQLLKLNIKSIKNERKIAFWSTLGGSVLTLIATYAKDIGQFVVRLLHLQDK